MRRKHPRESGNVFFALFAATVMVGIVGAGLNSVVRGPATTAANVTRHTSAENHMIMASRLAVAAAVTQDNNGDCDDDVFVEPLPWRDAGAVPHPNGGGLLPSSIGAASRDPWGSQYGYCAFDHGPKSVSDAVPACGTPPRRLQGSPNEDQPVIAVISAGKDRLFQTTCTGYVDAVPPVGEPDTKLVDKPSGSDDVVTIFTYAEASKYSDGLWKLKDSDIDTAEIGKNVEVQGSASIEGALTLGGGLILPDQTTSGDCDEANQDQIRRNTSVPGTTALEICNWDSVTSTGSWDKISGAGGVPTGAVVAFAGSTCPSGWTPVADLAGRVIIGIGTDPQGYSYSAGNTGGKATLTVGEALPEHSHKVDPVSFNATANSAGSEHAHTGSVTGVGAHGHTITSVTTSDGSHVHNYTGPQGSYTLKDGAEKNGIWDHNTPVAITGGAHGHNISSWTTSNGDHSHGLSINSSGAHPHTVPVNVPETPTTTVGTPGAHENRMPFKAYVYCESDGTPVEGVTLPSCTSGQTLQWNGTEWVCETAGAGLWQLHANNTDIYRASGNVGIGTPAPGYPLDVIGTIRAQGVSHGVIGSTSSTTGRGIQGTASATSGVNFGVAGHTESTTGRGVTGYAAATTGVNYGVQGASESTSGRGVQGSALATSGTTYGVYGTAASPDGRGVYGEATAGSGTTYGGYFLNDSTSGRGVVGFATATTGTTKGVHGRSDSTDGIGVWGEALATSGTTYGVRGVSASTTGRGVTGISTATTGANFGVTGSSASTSGVGIYGLASATTGAAYGIVGRSDSTDGQGMRGYASAATGFTYGVVGLSESTAGRGVYGRTEAISGITYGVYGEAASTDGRGIAGVAPATTGATFGVFGRSASPLGYGVWGENTGTTGEAVGVRGKSDSTTGMGVVGYVGATSGANYGVIGMTESTSGTGVRGYARAATGTTYAVIGQSNSTSGWGLYCNSANASGCGGNRAWNNASDGRLKDHIIDLAEEEGLAALMRLRPVTYKWKSEPDGKTELGFIAQEVEQVFPELVGNSPDTTIMDQDGRETTITDVKSLSYSGFVVPLVKAVQELKAENDVQRDRIAALESQGIALPASPPVEAKKPATSPLGVPWLVWGLLALNAALTTVLIFRRPLAQ